MQIRKLVCDDQDDKDTDLDKMEKAEILEKTLEVLTQLRQNSKSNHAINTRKAMAVRYASGFTSCAKESLRYIQNSHLVPAEVKVQLQNHLRNLTRRMETVLLVENQSVNFMQEFSASLISSSSLSSEQLAAVEMLRDDADNSSLVDSISSPLATDISETGNYCIVSPIHYSTPVTQKHISLNTPCSHKKQILLSYSHKSDVKTNNDTRITSINKSYNNVPNVHVLKKCMHQQTSSSDNDFVCQCSDMFLSESGLVKQNHHPSSSFSSESSHSQSYSPVFDHMSSVSSPLFLHPSTALPATLMLPNNTVYDCHLPTSSIVEQSIHLKNNPCLVTNAKQIKEQKSSLDHYYNKTQDQQISPETMWRPW